MAAVALALGGFGFTAFRIATLGGSDLSWGPAADKITASLALLLVAGSAGMQSAGHGEQEKQAERRPLEINALEPFLSLPRTRLRPFGSMADRMLVQPAPAPPIAARAEARSLGDLGSLFGAVLRDYNGKHPPS